MVPEVFQLPAVYDGVFHFRARAGLRAAVTPEAFFPGPAWYCHFARALGLDDGTRSESLADAGVAVTPMDVGVGAWLPDEPADIHVLTWGGRGLGAIDAALHCHRPVEGLFTGAFEYRGFTRGNWAKPEQEHEALAAALGRLASCETLTLRFRTPGRIKSGYVRRARLDHKQGIKKAVTYIDDRSVSLDAILRACWARLLSMAGVPFVEPGRPEFAGQISIGGVESIPIPSDCDALIRAANLIWLRSPYSKSRHDQKDTGGVMGDITIMNALPPFWLYCLLAAGRRHIGVYTSFGMGLLEVVEAAEVYKTSALVPRKSILERALHRERLKAAAGHVDGTAADVHGVTPRDLAYARDEWFANLRAAALSQGLPVVPLRQYHIPKGNGSRETRSICVPAIADRVLQRAVHHVMAPGIDAFLSSASFAFRKGLNREAAAQAVHRARREGFTQVIAADIESFFDSVPWEIVNARLRLLYKNDPIVPLIFQWISAPVQTPSGALGIRNKGLPQGMALSPLLANLVLDVLDRDIEAQGLRLVRYCDDFVVLTREGQDQAETVGRVSESLARLGLALHKEKTQIVPPDSTLSFLGFRITPEGSTEPSQDESELPFNVFSTGTTGKRSVYLAGEIRGARVSDENLVLLDRHHKPAGQIPWKNIGRIIAAGRVATTGAVQRAAMQKGVPILYLDLWGKLLGEAIPAQTLRPSLVKAQEALVENPELRLRLLHDTVAARIHNMRVVLRRHDINEPALQTLQEQAIRAETVDSLRGYEGTAARVYWQHFRGLVHPFHFPGRHYHPPRGPINALLSLLYTLLYHRLATMLRAEGFDCTLGFYHCQRAAHAALASDLMEEFRHVIELVVIRMISHGMMKLEDFPEVKNPAADNAQDDACQLPSNVFRKAVLAFENRMQKEFQPRNNERMSMVDCIHNQIRDYRAALLLKQPRTPFRID